MNDLYAAYKSANPWQRFILSIIIVLGVLVCFVLLGGIYTIYWNTIVSYLLPLPKVNLLGGIAFYLIRMDILSQKHLLKYLKEDLIKDATSLEHWSDHLVLLLSSVVFYAMVMLFG